MKKCTLLTFAGLVALTPVAFSQNSNIDSVVPVISGSSGSGRTYFSGPGAYRQIEEQVTQSARDAMALAKITQADDINYVLSAVSDIHNSYVEYAELVNSKDLLDMEVVGISGDTVNVDDFMRVVAELKVKKTAFESLLVKFEAINKETLPSNYSAVITSEGQTQQVPSPGVVNLSKVVNKYKELFNTELQPTLDGYKHIKIEIYGQVLSIEDYKSILNPDFSKVPELNYEKITGLTLKMQQLRRQSRNIGMNERNNFATVIRNQYNDFAALYGSDFKYVPRTGTKSDGFLKKFLGAILGSDDSRTETGKGETVAVPGVDISTDIGARNNAFKRLVDVFWMRSYLRLSQGIQICAIQPKLVEATNFGGFEAVAALKQLRTDTACTRSELEAALEYSRRILVYSGIQAEHVFGENGFMSAGLLNKLGSAVTFALGNRPSAEALHMLIQLVYADIQEELMMATPGQGLRALYDLYRARYQSSPEQKAYYQTIKCSVDYNSETCGQMDAFDETPGVGAEGDIIAIFKDLRQQVALSKDLINQADLINQKIEAMRADSISSQKAKDRAGNL